MTEDERQASLRDRLYAAYITIHAATSDPASEHLAFRRDIAPHLPRWAAANILDIGCGQGYLVRELIDSGHPSAHGVDISPEQVQAAHLAGITQVALGDYRDFLIGGTLDVVIGTDFFEHLTKFEVLEAMDRIRLSLRAGGTLIMRVPNAVSPFGGNYRHGDLTHETSFTPRSLRQLGAAAGFAAVEVHPCTPPVHGVKSALRAGAWSIASVLMKTALAAETGQVRGLLITQNIVAVLRAP